MSKHEFAVMLEMGTNDPLLALDDGFGGNQSVQFCAILPKADITYTSARRAKCSGEYVTCKGQLQVDQGCAPANVSFSSH